MRIFQWCKLDAAVSRSVLKFMLLFAFICAVIAVFTPDIQAAWPLLYMIFGGMMTVSTPFTAQPYFVEMLPTKIYERVFGRFLFGTGMIVLFAAAGFAMQTAYIASGDLAVVPALTQTAFFVGIALFLTAVQYLLLYLFQIKNVQIIYLIRMIPGFAFFFGFNSLLSTIQEEMQKGNRLPGWILWAVEHETALSVAILLAGIASVLLCAVVASVYEHRRMV